MVAHINALDYYNKNQHMAKKIKVLHGNRPPPFVSTLINYYLQLENSKLLCQSGHVTSKPMGDLLKLDSMLT